MMTILHLIPTLEGGGAERQLCMLAVEQAGRGLNVHVAVRRGGLYMQAMRVGGVHIHELGNARSINPRLFFAIRRTIGEVEPDIVQTWLPQMDILGGLGALQGRTRWIISERTSGDYYYKEIPVFARLRFLLSRYASAVVANSAGGEEYWRRAGPQFLKLATVRNALDFKKIQETASKEAGESNAKPLLLVVGRFDRDKAHATIVRALANLPDNRPAKVLMIGEGSEKPSIAREIEAASLSKRITILPYQADWWRWLAVADGLISMSRYEGNPNVVLETMAGGCPVILSDIPAHREVADTASALFVPVDDVQALSTAIAELIANKAAALRRAERASARVGSMTVKAMADAYDAVYKDVLNRKS
jgi:glycosyltransferase involved in cell wall biosynthesis